MLKGDEIDKVIEIFKDFDIENIGMLIVVCVVLICMATSYIQLLHASRIEFVLMNKNEEAKSFFVVYIIMFCFFGVINYFLTMNVELVTLDAIILIGTCICSFLLSFTKKGWLRKAYWWLEERKGIVIIITSVAVYTFLAQTLANIGRISFVILGAVAEVFIVAITFLNVGSVRASITVTLGKDKWYVFKRIDEKYLLCGDNSSINDAKKTRLISIEYIVEQNICFKQEINKEQ